METIRPLGLTLVSCWFVSLVPLGISGCGGSPSGAGPESLSGVYSSVADEEIELEFKSGGTVVAALGGEAQPGTYRIDGEKVLVTFNGQEITFIRDGDCIEDYQHLFGRMCKGGRSGDAKNVSTRTPPATTGTWSATNQDGEFAIEFQPGDKLRFSAKLADDSRQQASSGEFTLEGDMLYATLEDGTPLVLKWVNGGYESTAFGLPMRFAKR